jgi:hypothetical protein
MRSGLVMAGTVTLALLLGRIGHIVVIFGALNLHPGYTINLLQ